MSDKAAALQATLQRIPYARFLGVRAELAGDEMTAVLPFDDHLIGNPILPALHGGVIGAFMEMTAVLQLTIGQGVAPQPRPIDVTQFGGDQHFVAWWDPRGDCPGNCSFVSGDVSGAVWTLAPAALVPPPWRAIAYGAALALGIGMAAVRIMAGGHFFTDTVFAGVFTFLIIWVVHGLIYRWPRTRLTDESVDRAIERFALPGHDFLVGLLRKRKTEL